jgi:hypothetical protein
MARLDILDDIEKKADGYAVINILLSIGLNITGIYASINITTYIWRQLTGH